MTTTAIGINTRTRETWVKVLGDLKADQVGPIMYEVFEGFKVQGLKLSADVRTINISSQRFVLFGFR